MAVIANIFAESKKGLLTFSKFSFVILYIILTCYVLISLKNYNSKPMCILNKILNFLVIGTHLFGTILNSITLYLYYSSVKKKDDIDNNFSILSSYSNIFKITSLILLCFGYCILPILLVYYITFSSCFSKNFIIETIVFSILSFVHLIVPFMFSIGLTTALVKEVCANLSKKIHNCINKEKNLLNNALKDIGDAFKDTNVDSKEIEVA